MNSPEQFRDVAFPLNVYARAVELDHGQVVDLHYGLYENPAMSTAEAQRRSTDLLLRHLPPPCRLLEVGLGFGATLSRLAAAGYAATGITPDPVQLAVARARHGNALPAACARLEDFADDEGNWDALLFQESAQYVDALELFGRADALLSDQGEIVVLDEFTLRRDSPRRDNLHLLAHFLALAERFGFELSERLDLSAEAAPTLAYLVGALERHATALKSDLGVGDEALAGLVRANGEHRQGYAEGRRGYFLLRLRRHRQPRWRLGRVDERNSAAMRSLFAEVFRHPMSEAHWRWKYGAGRGAAVGVWDGDRMVAHYGGIARPVLFFGEPSSAAQSCDVMVAPAGRATLSRQGPLFLAAATYLESQLGYGKPHLLGVGFPSVRAWKAPAHLGLYGGPVGRMVELSWPAARGRPSLAVALRRLDLDDPRGRADADACWAAMRADLGAFIVGVRDAEALHHRYRAHPEKTYEFFVTRRRVTGKPLGLFVLRDAGADGCELMDLVGPLSAAPRLLAHARRAAATLGAARLFAWVVDNIAKQFGSGAAARDLDINVPANAWTQGPPIESLIGRWWLTGGDTDFR